MSNYSTCRACEGTGIVNGPGGVEPCYHCLGCGEIESDEFYEDETVVDGRESDGE